MNVPFGNPAGPGARPNGHATFNKENEMFPRRLEPILFGLVLSGLMSLIVSGIATIRMAGLGPDLSGLWLKAWLTAWPVAFPVVLFVAPVARRIVQRWLVPAT